MHGLHDLCNTPIHVQCQLLGVHGHSGVTVQLLVVVADNRGLGVVKEVTTVLETMLSSEIVTQGAVLHVSLSLN